MMHLSARLLTTAKNQQGFTLIEILIAIVVVGLVLTAVTSALSVSIKNSAEARYRARATTLSQEVSEALLRELSLLGWGEFVAFFPTAATPTTYCLQAAPSVGQLRSMIRRACTNTEKINEAGVSFTREIYVSKLVADPTEISIEITTRWTDGSRTPEVTFTRVFRKTDQ